MPGMLALFNNHLEQSMPKKCRDFLPTEEILRVFALHSNRIAYHRSVPVRFSTALQSRQSPNRHRNGRAAVGHADHLRNINSAGIERKIFRD
jgi:hypothetical protein